MATTPQAKMLARVVPNAATETLLYTVPVSAGARIDWLNVCHRGGAASTFRVSISPKGAATALTDYLYYDHAINGNTTLQIQLDIDLEARDVIRLEGGSANFTFILFGGTT